MIARFFLTVIIAVISVDVSAGVSLSKNRIIFNESSRDTYITLINKEDTVWLVQTRIKNSCGKYVTGDMLAIPPLFRLERNSQHVLRIIRQKNILPEDRESVYWFETVLIPSSNRQERGGLSDDKVENRLAYTLSLAVKLIYRPNDLPFTINKAFSKVAFLRTVDGVVVNNPTPYFITFSDLSFNGKHFSFNENNQMLKPYSKNGYKLKESARKIEWSFINDYGGDTSRYSVLLN